MVLTAVETPPTTSPIVPAARPMVTAAHGCYLRTRDGRTILDGCSGAVNVNLGHTHPAVVAAMSGQARDLHFTWRGLFDNPAVERLRGQLTAASGGRLTHHLLASSGSDGLEQAFRVAWRHHARTHGRRARLLAEWPSYHGMTTAALGASGHPLRHESLGAATEFLQPGWVHPPAEPGTRATAEAWERAIDAAGERLAAVVVEPVVGAAGGAVPHDPATLAAIRRAADRVGALVIADEVMTGFGRAGDPLVSDALGLAADIVVVSKGLGAGYVPIAACMVATRIAEPLADIPDLGTFGHTMAESPVAAAVASTVIETLDAENVPGNVRRRGRQLTEGLARLADRYEFIGSPRGRGLLRAVGVTTGDDALADCRTLVRHCLSRDLALYPAGVDSRSASLLVTPPLNSSRTEIDDLLDRLDDALAGYDKENR
ncbi:aminotransferase class III-fold pyridoxal phosphate-dependent enzyme [Nocardia sp. NPDC003482]